MRLKSALKNRNSGSAITDAPKEKARKHYQGPVVTHDCTPWPTKKDTMAGDHKSKVNSNMNTQVCKNKAANELTLPNVYTHTQIM